MHIRTHGHAAEVVAEAIAVALAVVAFAAGRAAADFVEG